MKKQLTTGNPILFNRPDVNIPSNFFNLKEAHKTTCDFGQLIPILNMECAPGDKITISPEALIRAAPMLAPVYARGTVRMDFFKVPMRLLWSGWEAFIAPRNETETPPAAPYFINVQVQKGSLGDYLGMPIVDAVGKTVNEKFSALDFYAYRRIFQEWYQDENINVMTAPIMASDGDNASNYGLLSNVLNRQWDKDYFMSGAPWPQKGPAMTIPIEAVGGGPVGDLPVLARNTGNPGLVRTADGGELWGGANVVSEFPVGGGEVGTLVGVDGASRTEGMYYDPNDSLYIDGAEIIGDVAGGTISELRVASALQRFFEAMSRGGSQFIEFIKTTFGVTSSDARLQRSEHLGTRTQNLVISEVLQTSASDTEPTPQGNMAGHGVSARSHDNITTYCEEHCIIMGIMSIIPDVSYVAQGIPKHMLKFDRFDYMTPLLANVGEQPILGKELFFDPDDTEANNSTWAYLPRYSEYKIGRSKSTGQFRDDYLYWTLDQKYSALPVLNNEFITVNPADTTRIFAVEGTSEDPVNHFLCHLNFDIKAERKLPKYNVPILQ